MHNAYLMEVQIRVVTVGFVGLYCHVRFLFGVSYLLLLLFLLLLVFFGFCL